VDRRLHIGIVALVVVAIALVFVMTYKFKGAEVAQPWGEIKEYLDQAEISLKEGNLFKAREIYSKVIEEHPDSLFVETAQNEMEKLNLKILFSPIKTENSQVYVVKEGDALRKIAKKYNTTVELIMKSNHLKTDLIRPGQRLKVTTAKFAIITDKSQNMLTLKADEDILKMYRVSTGLDGSTPTGKFKIVNKLVDPPWFKAGAIVPSGSPANILGSRWMGLSIDGYGIHGTTEPETIGSNITAGCVRMLNEDAEELYSIVPVGTEVTIVD